MANDYSIEAVANTGSLYNGLIGDVTYVGDIFCNSSILDYTKTFYNDNLNWKIRHGYGSLKSPMLAGGTVIPNDKEEWVTIGDAAIKAAKAIVEATSSAFFCETEEESKVNSEIKFGTIMYTDKTTGVLKAMAPGATGAFLGVKNGEPGWFTLEQLQNEC